MKTHKPTLTSITRLLALALLKRSALQRKAAAAVLLAAPLVLLPAPSAFAGNVTKFSSGTDLTAAGSWAGGSGPAPTAADVAVWDTGSLGAGLTLNSGTPSWLGIMVDAGASDPINIGSGGTLTVGASGIDMSASAINATIGSDLTLGADQTWNVNSAQTLTVSGNISGSQAITKSGAGTLTLGGVNSYGNTTVNGGTVQMASANPQESTAPARPVLYYSFDNVSGTDAEQRRQWRLGNERHTHRHCDHRVWRTIWQCFKHSVRGGHGGLRAVQQRGCCIEWIFGQLLDGGDVD